MAIIEHDLPWGGRASNKPQRVVIHAMAEKLDYEGAIRPAAEFLDYIKLSAHALVTPTGDVIRCRRDDQRAYHAAPDNTNTLGVEFLVPGVHTYGTFVAAIRDDYISESQLDSGITLVRDWMKAHDIPPSGIVKHSELNAKKVDPGDGFPWDEFIRAISA